MPSEEATPNGRPPAGPVDLHHVLDALPSLVAYVDADERNRYANRAAAVWLGHTPGEAEGRSVRELVGEEGYARVRHRVRAARAGQRQIFERVMQRADGAVAHTRTEYLPDSEVGPTGFVILVTDITTQVRAELAGVAGRQQVEQLVEAGHQAVGASDDVLQELYAIGLHLARIRRLSGAELTGAEPLMDALEGAMVRLRESIRGLVAAAHEEQVRPAT